MRIPLSPMDYYFYRRELYSIQFVFEYLGHLDLEKLKNSLMMTASKLPTVGSRLKLISEYQVELETGHVIPIQTRKLMVEPLSMKDPEVFVDLVQNIEGEPLIKVLVTETPTRTFFGVSFSHILGDGSSFVFFLNCLSKIMRSQDFAPQLTHERNFLKNLAFFQDMGEKSIKHAHNKMSIGFFESTGYEIQRHSEIKKCRNIVLDYSFQHLAQLKEKFHAQNVTVTNNDILMADLAKRFHKFIPLHREKFIIRCPVDFRNLCGLPQAFIGNAIQDALAIFQKDEIENMSLLEVAIRIRKSIQGIDKTSVLNLLRSIDLLRREKGIGIFEDVGCPGLLTSNLSKLPLAEFDVGLGRPMGIYPASFFPRLAIILPAAGGFQVQYRMPQN